MTESLLKAIALDDEIEVVGLPWLKPANSKVVGTNALTARILCVRHNTALSGLDATALRFFQTIEQIHANFGEDLSHQHPINGDEFERWLLKTLCGFAVAGMFVDAHGEKIVGWKAPLGWLEILFQGKPFPLGCGLHIVYPTHGKLIHTTPQLLRLAALTSPTNEIYGLRMWVFEQQIALLMGNPLDHAPAGLLNLQDHQPTDYRPAAIAYFDDVKTKAITFDWQTGPANKPFRIQMLRLADTTGH